MPRRCLFYTAISMLWPFVAFASFALFKIWNNWLFFILQFPTEAILDTIHRMWPPLETPNPDFGVIVGRGLWVLPLYYGVSVVLYALSIVIVDQCVVRCINLSRWLSRLNTSRERWQR